MRYSAFLTACLYAACRAQEFLLAGTLYTSTSTNCPITGNASASVDMLIWPANGADLNQVETEVNQYFDNKPPTYTNYTSTSTEIGLLFWIITINNQQACDIAALAGVGNLAAAYTSSSKTNTWQVDSVEVDGLDPDISYERVAAPSSRVVERDPAFTTQSQAVTELRMMSQPTTVPKLSSLPNYVFDRQAGSDVYIYIFDDGINTTPIVSRLNHAVTRSEVEY